MVEEYLPAVIIHFYLKGGCKLSSRLHRPRVRIFEGNDMCVLLLADY